MITNALIVGVLSLRTDAFCPLCWHSALRQMANSASHALCAIIYATEITMNADTAYSKNYTFALLLPSAIGALLFATLANAELIRSQSNNDFLLDDGLLDEIVITARRRKESAQQTPIAASVFDGDAIYFQNLTELNDLTAAVPGVNFTASGGANNTVFSIRGRSRGVFGNAQTAVTTYVNEVPLSTWGSNIPTYDMTSLEVLKGPQGTLFGRNNTAGAVLVSTERPSHEFSGYGNVTIGEYNRRTIEGALNVPLIDGKLALRIAGQSDDRNGHTDNVLHPASEDYGNRNRENYRISVLFEPNEAFSNLTIYEKNKIHEQAAPAVTVGYMPGGLVDGLYSCVGPADPSCNVAAHNSRQIAAGARKAYTDIDAKLDQELNSASNTTTLKFGEVTLKNIFGYREVYSYALSDIDSSPFPMVNTENITDIEQFSNELQISGELLENSIEYIGGLFWLKSQPNGSNRLVIQQFNPAGTPITSNLPAAPGAAGPSDYYTDISQAVFGQVSFNLGAINESLALFSMDIGVRHTKDRAENCPVGATHITDPIPTESACTAKVIKKSEETTYNFGVNFKPNDDLLLYAATRTGYRAGGVNSPILGGSFEQYQSYEPETVEDYELGLKSDWSIGGVKGRFNLALFHSDYEDVHYALPTLAIGLGLAPDSLDGDTDDTNDPTGGLFYSNSGDAKVKGVEAALTLKPSSSTTLTFSGSYIEKEVDVVFNVPSNWLVLGPAVLPTEEEIESFIFLGAPRWSYNIGIEQELPVEEGNGEVKISAQYFRIAKINYGGNVDAPSYESVDLRADWTKIMGSEFDAALYVTNLFDKDAIVGPSSSTSGLGINSGIYNDPRMWGASLRYNF